ncbi:MAG: dihydroxy-acid dehydratase, partial [Desulfosudaceae bacterium]
EAMEQGPIAVVREGDQIAINIPEKTITLKVDDGEIQSRLDQWQRPEPKITKGYMARYARMVSSANTGAIFK